MNDKFETIIRHVGLNLINKYKSNNIVLSGVNGPYDDSETRVRNLCHLIIITSIEYMISKKKELRDLLKIMADDLINEREAGKAYILRNKDGKDNSNGVIGHSWVIEAYIYLYKVFKDNLYLKICKELADLHVFDYNLCLWNVPSEKKPLNIDYTYNHQLWYAASLLELNEYLKDERIKKELESYFNHLTKISANSLNGKVMHSIYFRKNMKANMRQKIKKITNLINERMNRNSMKYKEEGYHLFNLMALARIYSINPNLKIFDSHFFKKALGYLNSKKYLLDLEDSRIDLDSSLHNENIKKNERSINIYGYSYNVPGFEIDYINIVFQDKVDQEIISCLKENQIKYTYDKNTKLFGLNCHDKNTINYRVYEYYRYLEKKYEKDM